MSASNPPVSRGRRVATASVVAAPAAFASTAAPYNVHSRPSRDHRAPTVINMVSNFERHHNTPAVPEVASFAELKTGRDIARWINDNKSDMQTYQFFQFMQTLQAKQTQSDHTFVTDFAAAQGLTYLCAMSVLRREEVPILACILDTLHIILNTRDVNRHQLIGYDLIREHSHCIQAIADMFESKEKTLKCKVLKLLSSICLTDDDGFEQVIQAIYAYNEKRDGSSVFDAFVKSMYFHPDLDFRCVQLKFINVILNLSPDLKQRVESRNMLIELGFDTIIEQLWQTILTASESESDTAAATRTSGDDDQKETMARRSRELSGRTASDRHNKLKLRYTEDVALSDPLLKEIREQLLIYTKMQDEDEQQLFWGAVNLNDPVHMVQHLVQKAIKQKHFSDLMATLIAMCTIPDHCAALWSSLSQLIVSATGQRLDTFGDQITVTAHVNRASIIEQEMFEDFDALKERLDAAMHETTVDDEATKKREQQIQELTLKMEQSTRDSMRIKNEKLIMEAKAEERAEEIAQLKQQIDALQMFARQSTIKAEATKAMPPPPPSTAARGSRNAPVPSNTNMVSPPSAMAAAPSPSPAPAPAPVPLLAGVPGPPPPTRAGAPVPATSSMTAAVPPPPPPPPGVSLPGVLLPPPLPGAPGVPSKSANLANVPKPRRKMVPFHWKPIKRVQESTDKGSIWNDISLENVQITVKNEISVDGKAEQTLQLNIDDLENLFGKTEKKKKKKAKINQNGHQHNDSTDPKRKKKVKREIVSLLDGKRAYNICIAVRQLKMNNNAIRDAILALDQEYLSLDSIEKLLSIVPTSEEQAIFQRFDGDANDLDVADKFCYALRDIESLEERLKFWKFKVQFEELCDDERKKIDVYTNTHDTVLKSQALRRMLQYVLLIGNYMNSGTNKGGVAGFNMESLLSLDSNKSNDKSESLLSFIVKELRKHDADALSFAAPFMEILPGAIKLEPDQIKANIDEIGRTLTALQTKVSENSEADASDKKDNNDDGNVMDDMFDTVMRSFYKSAQKKFSQLYARFTNAQKDLFELGVYLGQKNDDEFQYLQHLLTFAQNVDKQVAAMKKKEAEAARLKRQEMAKLNRRDAVPPPPPSKTKTMAYYSKVKTAKNKMYQKQKEESMLLAQGNNFAEDMWNSLTVDNIQKRRQSRWVEPDTAAQSYASQPQAPKIQKGGGRGVKTLAKYQQIKAAERSYDRRGTQFKIAKKKNKGDKKKRRKKQK